MLRRISKLWWTVVLAGLAALPGCTRINRYLGTESKYLLKAYDMLALPGQKVYPRARLESGTIQRDLPGRTIRFLKSGRLFNQTTTDDEGFAVMAFTPRRQGDYVFKVEATPTELKHKAPEPVELLVACRRASEPMIILDVDNTLAVTRTWGFFGDNPPAMPNSVKVTRRLARDYTIVYMTHRPQQYGHKTKTWLRQYGYPQGPLLMPEVVDFARGSRRYKTKRLDQLQSTFKNIQVGIGDKISDARAYHQNGVKAFLIVNVDELDESEDYLELAKKLEELPEQVQVVENWSQIKAGIYAKESFPRSAMQKELRRRAEQLPK